MVCIFYNMIMKYPESLSIGRVPGTVLVGALAMSTLGCTLGEQSGVAGSPPGVCSYGPFVPFEEGQTRERAAACERVMEAGKVALVVFGDIGKTQEELEQDARSVEGIVRMATNGLVNISVGIVRASAEAEARRQESLSGIFGCVDYKVNPSSAQIANETMPELGDYDSVVSVGPWPACDWNVGAGFTPDGQSSNVHMGGEALELLPTIEGVVGSPMAMVAAHEFLHQLGLKHNNTLENSKLPEFGGMLDVRAMAADKRVGPRGLDGSIMTGDLISDIRIVAVKPNPVDLDRLRWPMILQGERPYAAEITTDGAVFDAESYEWQFFTLQLNEPMTFSNYKRKDESGHESFVGFGRLVIVPIRGDDGRGFVGFMLGYEQDGETVWHEGPVTRNATSPETMVVECGGQQIELRISDVDGTISARQLAFAIL